MLDERSKCNFNQVELTHSWYGGKEKFEQVQSMMADMENDEVLRFTHKWYEMTREEQIDLNFKRVARVFQVYKHRYTNYKIDYINWYSVMFQGIVSLMTNRESIPLPELWEQYLDLATFINKRELISNIFVVPLRPD